MIILKSNQPLLYQFCSISLFCFFLFSHIIPSHYFIISPYFSFIIVYYSPFFFLFKIYSKKKLVDPYYIRLAAIILFKKLYVLKNFWTKKNKRFLYRKEKNTQTKRKRGKNYLIFKSISHRNIKLLLRNIIDIHTWLLLRRI